MTFEHRLLVGFGEIKAVVFECNECKTRTSIPIQEFSGPPPFCPKQHGWNTNKPLMDAVTPAFKALAQLLQALRDPTETLYTSAGFKIFLEFDAEE